MYDGELDLQPIDVHRKYGGNIMEETLCMRKRGQKSRPGPRMEVWVVIAGAEITIKVSLGDPMAGKRFPSRTLDV